jgi:hypothetical protein
VRPVYLPAKSFSITVQDCIITWKSPGREKSLSFF